MVADWTRSLRKVEAKADAPAYLKNFRRVIIVIRKCGWKHSDVWESPHLQVGEDVKVNKNTHLYDFSKKSRLRHTNKLNVINPCPLCFVGRAFDFYPCPCVD